MLEQTERVYPNPADVPLKPEQYRVLLAVATGAQCTLWPSMRRSFLRKGWIRCRGAAPPIKKGKLAKQPTREYEITESGYAKLSTYKGYVPADHRFPYILFGKAIGQ